MEPDALYQQSPWIVIEYLNNGGERLNYYANRTQAEAHIFLIPGWQMEGDKLDVVRAKLIRASVGLN